MCGIVDDIVDGAEAVGGAIVDGAKAVGGAVVDGAKAVGGAIVDGVNAGEHAVEAAVGTVVHGVESAVHDIGSFVSEHSSEIISGLETAGTAVLAATGVGAPLAALLEVGLTSGAEIAQGKGIGTAILDGVSAGADKLVPGAGAATHTVITGLENGDSVAKIVHDAGLEGLGPNGGPLIGVAGTLSHDIANGDSVGRVLLDLGSQYAGEASGVGSDHASVLGQLATIGVNDAVDGKGLGAFGLDVAKAYVDQAAGGYGSPTGQAANTILDGIAHGKSAGDIFGDVYHQAVGEAGRVDAAVPGSVNATVSGSGLFGAHYLGTAAGDIADGKSLGDIAKDLGKQAAGDLNHMVDGTKSDPSNSVGDVLKNAANTLGHGLDGGQTAGDGGTHPPAEALGHTQSDLMVASDGASSSGSGAASRLLIGEVQAASVHDALAPIASSIGATDVHLSDFIANADPAPASGVNTLDNPAPAGVGETIGHVVDQIGIVGPHAAVGDAHSSVQAAVEAAVDQPQHILIGTIDVPMTVGDAHSSLQAAVEAAVDQPQHTLPLHVGTSDASEAPNHPMDVLATSAGIAIGAQGDDPSGSAAQDEGHGTAGSGTAIDLAGLHAAQAEANPAGIIVVGGAPADAASDPATGHGGGFWDVAAEASGLGSHAAIASDGGLSHLAHAVAAPAFEASASMVSLADDMHSVAASHATAALADVGHVDIGVMMGHDVAHHATADFAHFHA